MSGVFKYTMCLKTPPHLFGFDYSVKIELISIIFGVQYPEEFYVRKLDL